MRANLGKIGGEMTVIAIAAFEIFKVKIITHKPAMPGY